MIFPFRIKKKNNGAAIEQMCGIIMIGMQDAHDNEVLHELEIILGRIKDCEPMSGFEIMRVDKSIISKLREVRKLIKEGKSSGSVLAICAEIGLILLEREGIIEKLERQQR